MIKKFFSRRKNCSDRTDESKVFCIGRNKTGTTSLEKALSDFGYRMGNQAEAERLMEFWARRDFQPIIEYCKKYDCFQDAPFSLKYTYQMLDYAFPNSKFILSVRDNPEQWYNSVVKFHTKLVGKDRVPTSEDLKAFEYREKGWLWRQQELVYGASELSLYDKDLYIKNYLDHNNSIKEYFRYRPDDLLVVNLSESDSMKKLCLFLAKTYSGQRLPHLNKTAT